MAARIDGFSSAQEASVHVAERKLTIPFPNHSGVGEEASLLRKASDGAKAGHAEAPRSLLTYDTWRSAAWVPSG